MTGRTVTIGGSRWLEVRVSHAQWSCGAGGGATVSSPLYTERKTAQQNSVSWDRRLRRSYAINLKFISLNYFLLGQENYKEPGKQVGQLILANFLTNIVSF